MSGQGLAQIVLYVAVVVALAYPLGLWMARVYGTFRAPRPLAAIERGFYRLVGTDPNREQDWKSYGITLLVVTVISGAALYALQRLQAHLLAQPRPPQGGTGTHRAEHDRELPHEHELPVLRRRVRRCRI